MRILIDTNVILDILQKREPFFADSYRALRKAIETDAVAQRNGASYILTRNIKDFAGSAVLAILPTDFLNK